MMNEDGKFAALMAGAENNERTGADEMARIAQNNAVSASGIDATEA